MIKRDDPTDGVLRRTVIKAGAVAVGALAMSTPTTASEHEEPQESEERRKEYVIAVSEITDLESYMNEYLPAAAETVAAYGGTPLVVSFDPDVVEGEWDHTITVVLEFPCAGAVRDWRNDETYQELREMRNEWVNYTNVVVTSQFSPEELA